MDQPIMTVNDLAKAVRVTPHVVRYYSRIGLLRPGRNPTNNYKLFTRDDLRYLRFIRKAQHLGFSLAEIEIVLEHAREGRSPCPEVRGMLAQRVAENRRKLAELESLQRRMEAALSDWEALEDGSPDGASICRLIESATDSD